MSDIEPQDYLLSVLSSGPISTSKLYPWAETKGINKRALQRAAKKLGINIETLDPENGRYRLWTLPATCDTDSELRQPDMSHVPAPATPNCDTGAEVRQPDVSHFDEPATTECRESVTCDTELRQAPMSHDTEECRATSQDDARQIDTGDQVSDTSGTEPDTAKTVLAAPDTAKPVATTAATVADLDLDDRSTVIEILSRLIDADKFEIIDGYALNHDLEYADVLNSFIHHGIKRVISLQKRRRA